MNTILHRFKTHISRLPDKKQYVELITATLTVPVLATAVVLNLNNLKPKDQPPQQPTPAIQEKIVYISPSNQTPVQQVNSDCKKGLSPLEITSPSENETLSDNPVTIDIDYTQGDYCGAVWSYRINDGKWSGYDDKSIALYNLTPGKVRFELKVKSLSGGSEKVYTRTFTYTGETTSTPSVTESPTATPSAQ